MVRIVRNALTAIITCSLLSSCNFNPFVPYSDNTGTAGGTIVGGSAGLGAAAIANASRWWTAGAGFTGGAIGYYVTSMRFESGGIIHYGGKAYQIGQTIGIYIPTDSLFEPNSFEFLPQAPLILDSALAVLKRQPNNNILLSGNTSGFGQTRDELWLSEKRAERIAAYFWNTGSITPFRADCNDTSRKLVYVGYGDYFPIAGDIKNKSIRQNSRIQIVSYPKSADLRIDTHYTIYNNVGVNQENQILQAPQSSCLWDKFGNAVTCYQA